MAEAGRSAGPDALEALAAAGHAYVTFAQTHLGHFRVMFERSLVDLHEDAAPMPEAERTYDTLMGLSEAAHAAGYGRGLSGEEIAHLCWSSVHGVAILIVEGVLRSKAQGTGVTESAIARGVVENISRLLDSDKRPLPGV